MVYIHSLCFIFAMQLNRRDTTIYGINQINIDTYIMYTFCFYYCGKWYIKYIFNQI